MKNLLFLLTSVAVGFAQEVAPPYLNLDFETVTRGQARGWPFGTPGYEAIADSQQVQSGERSLRIRNTGGAATVLAGTAISLPLEALRGKRLRVSGYMRTSNLAGLAAFYFRVDGQAGSLSFDTTPQPTNQPENVWVRYEFNRVVSEAAQGVVLGMFLRGPGTAWFDNFQVEVDGVPLAQGAVPDTGEPKPALLDWIRETAIPFTTADADSGLSDLAPVKDLVGKARIVGLGEGTHGTSQYFRMKHRLVEYLATEMGFTIFSIEANMPEAYRINDYVMTGRGDPKKLLQGMYFWTWNTQEVLELVEWMRRFNASGRGRIQFTGFDMQTGSYAASLVAEYAGKVDPAFLPEVQTAYAAANAVSALTATSAAANAAIFQAGLKAEAVRRKLEANFQKYAQASTPAEAEWAVQNARVVEEAVWLKFGGSPYRDEMMAQHTKWILDQNPGARMAIWAHNYHVSRTPGAQGSYLGQWYGADYLVLGFAMHEGTYSAVSTTLNSNNVAVPSFPGTVEYAFWKTGMPQFILDLRKAALDNGGAWLLGEVEFREIGSVATDGFYVSRRLVKDYDGLIFFDRTTASALLPF